MDYARLGCSDFLTLRFYTYVDRTGYCKTQNESNQSFDWILSAKSHFNLVFFFQFLFSSEIELRESPQNRKHSHSILCSHSDNMNGIYFAIGLN